jgi:hypothetical protein
VGTARRAGVRVVSRDTICSALRGHLLFRTSLLVIFPSAGVRGRPAPGSPRVQCSVARS